jgi:hypothetical protein
VAIARRFAQRNELIDLESALISGDSSLTGDSPAPFWRQPNAGRASCAIPYKVNFSPKTRGTCAVQVHGDFCCLRVRKCVVGKIRTQHAASHRLTCNACNPQAENGAEIRVKNEGEEARRRRRCAEESGW